MQSKHETNEKKKASGELCTINDKIHKCAIDKQKKKRYQNSQQRGRMRQTTKTKHLINYKETIKYNTEIEAKWQNRYKIAQQRGVRQMTKGKHDMSYKECNKNKTHEWHVGKMSKTI